MQILLYSRSTVEAFSYRISQFFESRLENLKCSISFHKQRTCEEHLDRSCELTNVRNGVLRILSRGNHHMLESCNIWPSPTKSRCRWSVLYRERPSNLQSTKVEKSVQSSCNVRPAVNCLYNEGCSSMRVTAVSKMKVVLSYLSILLQTPNE